MAILNERLLKEIRLLTECEVLYGLPSFPVIRQLTDDADRPLPDVLPPAPQWTTFHWPTDTLDFTAEWRRRDRER